MAAILCSKAGNIMILSLPVTGVFNTNAYFYIDDATGHGFLLDPGAEADTLLAVIRQRGFVIEKILLTHGHFDHMGAAAQIQDALSIPICMHERGREYTENPRWNLSKGCGLYIKLDDVSSLPDGSRIALERNPVFSLTMHYVPGHTTDSVFYYSAKDNVAFVGDSIFKNSFGLTHFPGGDGQTLMQSITQSILKLPQETVLLSGHTEPTTVGAERERSWYAPFLN